MPVPEDWRASLRTLFVPLGAGMALGKASRAVQITRGGALCTPEQQQPGVQLNLGNYSSNCTKIPGEMEFPAAHGCSFREGTKAVG